MRDARDVIAGELMGLRERHGEPRMSAYAAQQEADEILSALNSVGLKVLGRGISAEAARKISDKYYDTTDELVSAIARDVWDAANPTGEA